MADSSLLMPGVDEAYREARDRLRNAEIDLRDRIESVAAMRRSLPPGPAVPDYTFIDGDKRVRLSELFDGDKSELIVYHLMYWADDDEFCPMCSLWIDGLDGIVPHVTQRANLVIASRAPFDKLQAWGAHRGWNRLRLLSDDGPPFARDIDAEDADGRPIRRSSSSTKKAIRCAIFIPRIRCSKIARAASTCSAQSGISSTSRRPAAVTGTERTKASTPLPLR